MGIEGRVLLVLLVFDAYEILARTVLYVVGRVGWTERKFKSLEARILYRDILQDVEHDLRGWFL